MKQSTNPQHFDPFLLLTEKIKAMRIALPRSCLDTEIVYADESGTIAKATITDENGNIIATGHGYEADNSTPTIAAISLDIAIRTAVDRAMDHLGIGIPAFDHDEKKNPIARNTQIPDSIASLKTKCPAARIVTEMNSYDGFTVKFTASVYHNDKLLSMGFNTATANSRFGDVFALNHIEFCETLAINRAIRFAGY